MLHVDANQRSGRQPGKPFPSGKMRSKLKLRDLEDEFMSFPELLDAIQRLSQDEQRQLRLMLDQGRTSSGSAMGPTGPATEQAYLQQLAAAGRISHLPAQATVPHPSPVCIPGRPLSQTLVEDRR
jgi:hypothetical protein